MSTTQADDPQDPAPSLSVEGRLPVIRSAVGGLLMGLANLVPGVSGGTMILVMGLYDELIASIADVTRLRFTRRGFTFLCIVAGVAGTAIATLAGTLSRAVTLHESAMFSLFIGMTLAGVPLLARRLGRLTGAAAVGLLLGLGAMMTIALTKEEPPDKQTIRAAVAAGEFLIEPAYARDVAAGVLGMSAMVLPGISGAYMLLVLDRYTTILAAIAEAKDYVVSLGQVGTPAEFLGVLVPVAIGALVSLVALSNLLKWMLHRHEQATLGFLLGILLGSAVGIWPFDGTHGAGDYALGAALALAGFVTTHFLSRISA